jgi:polysaccharide biosynthesis/export protein
MRKVGVKQWTGFRNLLAAVVIVFSLGVGSSSQEQPQKSAASSPTPNTARMSAKLGAGDLLDISVYGVPELTTRARISHDGDIYLPLIGYISVQGLTVEETQTLIEKRLSEGGFVNNPHATVFVAENSSQMASLLGEVARPGVYPVMGERRLFELVSAAGGFTDRAGKTITVTRKESPSQPITLPLAKNLADVPGSNVMIYAGDIVTVPKADIVYVVGDVGRPSGLLMDFGNLTVLQAIALAGGTARTAKLNDARLLRKGANGIEETPVPLKKMLQAKAPDLPMQPNDILFVPTSTGKIIAGHTLQTALQAAASVGIVAAVP